MPDQKKKAMMTVAEVAEMLQVDVKTVNNWIHAEKSPFPGAYQISDKRTAPYLIPTDEVDALKKARGNH